MLPQHAALAEFLAGRIQGTAGEGELSRLPALHGPGEPRGVLGSRDSLLSTWNCPLGRPGGSEQEQIHAEPVRSSALILPGRDRRDHLQNSSGGRGEGKVLALEELGARLSFEELLFPRVFPSCSFFQALFPPLGTCSLSFSPVGYRCSRGEGGEGQPLGHRPAPPGSPEVFWECSVPPWTEGNTFVEQLPENKGH